jgi:ABC-2 type transport system ATP-binding protein
MTSIETRNLTMVYKSRRGGEIVAVESLDLSIRAGEVFGLLGPNGAGKTTTIRMLCGLIRPTRGTVHIDGIDLSTHPQDVRRRVALVPEDAGDFRNLTLREELDYYGALYGLGRATVRQRSEELLARLGLSDRCNDLLKTFSRGMRRKFHLVRAVLHQPRVLLLDEPTAGLDPNVVEDVWDLLKALARDHRVTVVLCSHHLEEVERLCDRVGILKRRLLVEGPLAELSGAHRTYRIRLADSPNGCAEAAARVAGVRRLERSADDRTLRVHLDGEPAAIIPELVRRLVASGADVVEVAPHGRDLRSLYRDAIIEDDGGGGEGATP